MSDNEDSDQKRYDLEGEDLEERDIPPSHHSDDYEGESYKKENSQDRHMLDKSDQDESESSESEISDKNKNKKFKDGKSKSKKSKLKNTIKSDHGSSFVPDQTKSIRGKTTRFDIVDMKSNEEESPEKMSSPDRFHPKQTIDEYDEEYYEEQEDEEIDYIRTYHTDFATQFYNYGKFHLSEMVDRVERHHKETVRNMDKTEFVKPYLNKVHGSYYTGNAMQKAHYDPSTIGKQEFIDR